MRSAAPLTALWGGPGTRFDPGTGGLEAVFSAERIDFIFVGLKLKLLLVCNKVLFIYRKVT